MTPNSVDELHDSVADLYGRSPGLPVAEVSAVVDGHQLPVVGTGARVARVGTGGGAGIVAGATVARVGSVGMAAGAVGMAAGATVARVGTATGDCIAGRG